MKHTDYFYTELKEQICKSFNNFSSDYDSDEQYMLMFQLSEFIASRKGEEPVVDALCLFLNKAVAEGGSYTFDVLNLELFPMLLEDRELLKVIKTKVSPDSNTVLDFYDLIRKKQFEINKRISKDDM